ncbi:hypothetical protein HMPREF0522_0902 [Lactobacillus iners UPII 143-D]|nr:hypothetical protein HMPREF9218_0486 [Lactobacillus iners LEAF 2062A-h1]EGC79278.1 hypothetical protein HMPREF0522_0902 [Lactobacillus iners UPII 143-D]
MDDQTSMFLFQNYLFFIRLNLHPKDGIFMIIDSKVYINIFMFYLAADS